jgi:tetratricopeptide (TPR) repeat protein
MSNRILIGLAALVAAGFVAFFGGAFASSPSAPVNALAAEQSVEDFKAGFALNASTQQLVSSLQSALEVNPKDEHSWALLGLAYQQRARETGDPTYYTKSDGALHQALELDSKDYLVWSGLGSLALSRHRFYDAFAYGSKALSIAPKIAMNYGVIGDALIELGRYPQAFKAFQTMGHIQPSLTSYSRISYARELRGETAEAIASMKLAVDAATDTKEPLAWIHVQLGKLYFNHGHYAAAVKEQTYALRIFPLYPYGLDALAQSEAAEGHVARAIRLERAAVDRIPLPAYVSFLGDLYKVSGHPVLAEREYSLIGAINRLLQANGVRTDLDIALFQADHGIDLKLALVRARIGESARPSIDGSDVLAWTLARNGRCAAALPYSIDALHLGTQDALKFFHRGMIERCLGNTASARAWFRRALALNPHFSLLWAPVARRYAR